ncbi:hypothetical protein ART_0067 [Arthrobacter sp. PAMC 25486]|uniref:DUF488 domain-containing protein n=1 Tax=Arthrobacter sp. PAMC 25486 TaxID=1494608 RepID=UPI0005360265|nr:DUF488 domain-containing protein [Arthrobacter sp. PAMC 25486]AIX99665.1 hypothetical protein ART_0067 [Arthrobacter sp. PAMC 25486]
MGATTVFTIGHSTHPLEEFVDILGVSGIELLIDVRTVPGSRHNPQFGGDALAASMPRHGIEYRQMKDLGGLRHTPAALAAQSINGAWRNKSFRNYADYMQTTQFTAAVGELIDAAAKQVVVIMCAEAVPWRCHRSLIGDALLVREIAVMDIMGKSSVKPHALTRFARTKGTRLWYPPEEKRQETNDGGTLPL